MKKKLIIITFLGAVLSVIIYMCTKNDELTLVTIGDSLSEGMTSFGIEGISYNDYLKEYLKNEHKLKEYYEYAHSNKTLKELVYEIKENKLILFKDGEIEIKHAINDADILTIAIGMDEINNKKITNQVRTEYKEDFTLLCDIIKELSTSKVIIIGLYTCNSSEKLNIEKLNAIIRDISLTYGFTFLDISSFLTKAEYFSSKDSYLINYLGHKKIYKELKKILF